MSNSQMNTPSAIPMPSSANFKIFDIRQIPIDSNICRCHWQCIFHPCCLVFNVNGKSNLSNGARHDHVSDPSLIFYVGNCSTSMCSSILHSVIVGCVMMRWKMNENFTRRGCTNTIASI